MIDIHNHIIPGVDDGAQTEQDSIRLAEQAVAQGIHTVVATPHHKNRHFDNYKLEIETSVELLNELLKSKSIPLDILVGQEVRVYGDIVDDFKNGEIATVNHSQYILLEFPFKDVPYYADQLLYDIQIAGLNPVIVHPERNDELCNHPDRLYDFVVKGALTQVTAGSFFGDYGEAAQKMSYRMVEHNLTHLIASDAHHTEKRPFQLKQAYDLIKSEYGIETYSFFLENAQLLVDDMTLNQFEPIKPGSKSRKKKGFFSRFKRK